MCRLLVVLVFSLAWVTPSTSVPCSADWYINTLDQWTSFCNQECTSVGSLSLLAVAGLKDLTGCETLETISGTFQLDSNPDLKTFEGFENVQQIGKNLIVHNHPVLQSISSLNVESLPAVNISGNKKLKDIALSTVSIEGDFILENNTNLPSIGMEMLVNITGTFYVDNNPALSSLSLPSLEAIGGDFTVSSNDALQSIDTNPKSFNGWVDIENNGVLQDISGFQSCLTLLGIQVTSNAALTSISGFNSLTTISTEQCSSYSSQLLFSIDNNPSLQTITGFQSLTSLSQLTSPSTCSFRITDCPALTSISGLKSLSSVKLNSKNFEIGQTGLTTLDDLSSLTVVDIGSFGEISIHDNPQLESIDGLGNVITLTGGIDVYDNGNLENCLTTLCYLGGIATGSGCGETTGNGPYCTCSYCTN